MKLYFVCSVLLYFALARSKVKLCFYFHILWCCAVQLPENIAHLGKYSTLGKNKCSVTIWHILLLNSVQIMSLV